MEIRVSATELLRSLTALQGVVQRKNTMPILSNLLVQANRGPDGQGSLVLSATDLDMGMRITKACEVTQEGSTTVSARALFDIVKMLPGPDVTLSHLPNQNVLIRSGRTNAKLVALPPEEFPQLPQTDDVRFYKIPTAVFMEMATKTLYSTSADENRYNLMGVFMEPQKNHAGQFSFVSTDGHRLSRVERVFGGEAYLDLPRAVILPRKGLGELIRILDSEESSDNWFEFGCSKTQAIAKKGHTLLTMRLIDGDFPDYERVIPKISDKILRASRLDFLTSLKRVSVLTSDRSQSVRLTTLNGELSLSCANPEAGEVLDNFPIEYSGADIEMRFNARYMIEALSSLSDNNLMLKLTDSLSPMLITGTTDESHLCVVMPMRM